MLKLQPRDLSPRKQKNKKRGFWTSPSRAIAVSFGLVILLGTILLTLPWAARSGQFTNPLDALFTATSATCVTGIVVYDTYLYWTPFGQGVILGLIQVGGLGLVTITSFFNLLLRRRLSLRSRALASESVSSVDPSSVTALVKTVFKVSLTVEALGALALLATFYPKYDLDGIFLSVFLAVSAYCNGGFDLLGREGAFSSLTNYAENPAVILPITLLIIIGGLGFLVWSDLAACRKTKRLGFQTKLVLGMTGALILGGALLIGFFEWNNPHTMGELSFGGKLLAALFQSVTCRTAGFNTIDFASCREPTKLVMTGLMMIGAAPGSTGGGLKLTTIAVLIAVVSSVIKGRSDCVLMNRRLARETVYKALTVVLLGVGVAAAGTMLVQFFTPEMEGLNVLLETVSAFSTTGVSVGVTASTGILGRLTLILCMILGRVGPVSMALALAQPEEKAGRFTVLPEGKIQIG